MHELHRVKANGKTYRIYEDDAKRYLRIDGTMTTQSVGGEGPTGLYYDDIAGAVPLAAKSVLMLGLGAGTVFRLLRELGHEGRFFGVESDPTMLSLARSFFRLDELRVDIYPTSAEKFNASCAMTFDVVIVDAYEAALTPVVTGTLLDSARGLVAAGGTLIVNDFREEEGNTVTVERL